MVRHGLVEIFILIVVVQTALPAIFNSTIKEVDNAIKPIKTRRKGSDRSTSSSSSGEKKKDSDDRKSSRDISLDLSSSSSSTSSEERLKYPKPVSSEERRGWRKWHRKCTPCPGEMKTKWREHSIDWICGAYQRARRSFKSACMMRLRNCQDGTMFVKISNRRCENDTQSRHHGDHFFYEYKAKLSDDSSDSTKSKSSSTDFTDVSSTSEDSDDTDDFRRKSGNKTKVG